MTLPVFPDISPSYTFEETLQFSTLIIPYGDLSEQRISRNNQPRLSFKLQWNTLSASDREILQQFFLDRKGSFEAFTFIHILPSQVIVTDGLNYTCKKTHIATLTSPITKPATGEYLTYWIQEGYDGTPWVKGYSYKYDFTVKFKEDITTVDYFNYLLYSLNTIELIEIEKPTDIVVHDVTATIISISPNPAEFGAIVSFSGSGSDTLPHLTTVYSWRSDVDGVISTTSSFTKNDLTVGSHNIFFKVKCSDNVWSPEIAWSSNPLVITNPTHDVTATIISISPNPANQGSTVSFSGSGYDSLSHAISAYSWRSDVDGVISTTSSFTKNDLTVGSHNIFFKVKCSDNVWSPEIAWSSNPLVINLVIPETSTWKNYFGASTIDTAANRIKYAKQMGYDYIGITGNAGDTTSLKAAMTVQGVTGLKFYVIDPMYSSSLMTVAPALPGQSTIAGYTWSDGGRNINPAYAYTQAQKDWYNARVAWGNAGLGFPNNHAKGWYWSVSQGIASVIWDFQQQAVITEIINKIIINMQTCEDATLNFKCAGYMLDIADFDGDMHSISGGTQPQVDISYWTGTSSCLLHDGITHEFATYRDGVAAFYKQFKIALLATFPIAKWIIDPARIWAPPAWGFEEYVYVASNRSDASDLIPDLLMQEGWDTDFVDQAQTFNALQVNVDPLLSGLGLTKSMVGCHQRTKGLPSEDILMTAKAGINGAWYNWFILFGYYGSTTSMPWFPTVAAVYPRLKLARCIANWDNLNNIPLVSRSWNGTTYAATVGGENWSFMNANVYYTRFYKNTNKLFIVFINNSTSVPIPLGKSVVSIKRINGYFEEDVNGASDVTITTTITLNSLPIDNNGRGYIVTLI